MYGKFVSNTISKFRCRGKGIYIINKVKINISSRLWIGWNIGAGLGQDSDPLSIQVLSQLTYTLKTRSKPMNCGLRALDLIINAVLDNICYNFSDPHLCCLEFVRTIELIRKWNTCIEFVYNRHDPKIHLRRRFWDVCYKKKKHELRRTIKDPTSKLRSSHWRTSTTICYAMLCYNEKGGNDSWASWNVR